MDTSKDFFEELLQYFEKTIFMQKTNDFLLDEFLSSGFHCWYASSFISRKKSFLIQL